jgi:hypothetical protein
MNFSRLRIAIGVCGIGGCVASLDACGGRPSYWNNPIDSGANSYGLTNGVALVDDASHRVVMVTVPAADLQVAEQSLSIGHQVVNVAVAPDASRLFVLSAGDWPRRTLKDEFPSLTVVDFPVGSWVAQAHQYPMSEPLENIALDPGYGPEPDQAARYAVAYAGSGAGTASTSTSSFVQNPNEIVLFDLLMKRTVTRTIRSFGGTPQRLVFTPVLALPAGPRRLLLIETDIDLTILDLTNAFNASPPPEITVPLTSGTTTQRVTTAGLAVDGRDPTDPNDARFAVWASNNTNVFTLQLVAAASGAANDFVPTIKLTDVGGIPSDVAFVETEDATAPKGLALQVAALVPSRSTAVLVDPDNSLTTTVMLPAPYANFSLVTGQVASTPGTSQVPGTDVALLWNGGGGAQSGVALWTLTHSVQQPYASIATLGATAPIAHTYDVPSPNQQLKVLQMASSQGFYVLDLASHTAPPLDTMQSATLSIAPDGLRLWAFDSGGTDLAAIAFKTLNPIPLTTDVGISGVYDVMRPDGGRALVALHDQGAIGATVFDARNPVTATSRRVASLLLEGP